MKECYNLKLIFKEFKSKENCSFAMSKLVVNIEKNFLSSKIIPISLNINNNEGELVLNFPNRKNYDKIINEIKYYLEKLKKEYYINNIELKEI
jgi:hypothetical protein